MRMAWSNEPDAVSALWFVELAIDVYFLIDIVLNFRVRPAITVCRDAPWRLSDSVSVPPPGCRSRQLAYYDDATGVRVDTPREISMNVRARRGRLRGLSVNYCFPYQISFVWGFCVGAQGA